MTDTPLNETAAATLARMIRAAYVARDLDQLRALDTRVGTYYMLSRISAAEFISLDRLICDRLARLLAA